MEWYLKVLKNYVGFSGRARRTEYWMFTLFNCLAIVAAIILDNVFGLAWKSGDGGPIYLLYVLAVLLPSLAVGVRRLHDIGKSGWWLLLAFIPLIGAIILLIWHVREGDHGNNAYGPNPKAGEGTAAATVA
jgi:uncharacterized membrane protein YhaH (DUF805 family)